MKYFKLTIYTLAFLLALTIANNVRAVTEFVSTIDPDNAAGTDYTSLSAWEGAVQADLTSASTSVFSYSTASGTIPDLANVQGETSGATASSTHMTASTTSSQILLTNIVGSFQSGETVYIQGQATSSTYVILSNTGDSAIAVAKCRSTNGTADTTAVTIDGWTTSATNYIKIWTDPDDEHGRHGGKWDSGKYRLEIAADGEVLGLTIWEDYIRVDGIQLSFASASSLNNWVIGFYIIGQTGVATSDVRISNCIIKWTGSGTNLRGANILVSSSNCEITLKVWNNVIYDFNVDSGCRGFWGRGAPQVTYYYNNTTHNCSVGIQKSNGTVIAKNNIVADCQDSYNGAFSDGTDYNVTDSSDNIGIGSNNKVNQTFTFIDETNDDFHLSLSDTSAKNAGTDLSSDSNLSFSTDIEGHNRLSGVWDIGADEAPEILYRSVGDHSTDLNTDSATVTIASTTRTATFSVGMPDNVGVGDVLQFGNSGYYDLAFITARTSSTTYSVSAWDGAAPTATTSAAVSVYRAHLHLDDWEDHILGDENFAIDATVDDYITLFNTDLVASNTAMFVPCYASTTADDLAVTINGWTTGTSSYIKIYTPVGSDEVGISQRHGGGGIAGSIDWTSLLLMG